VLGVPADVTDEDSVAALVATTLDRYGRIDGLVNNAAIYDGLAPTPAAGITHERWRAVMEVNVWGTFLCSRAVHPVLRDGGGGRIVNISSNTALFGPPMMPDYVASKGAIMALTRSLAREWGTDRVTVNAVAPGGTWTEATEHMFGASRAEGADPERIRATSIAQQAIRRQQYPGDVVGAVAFLLSDHAAMITGQTVVVDGGLVLH
jgi:NAD(P)-dependent dehydrogenase (short-subunit alcohol dehydrogenase family)